MLKALQEIVAVEDHPRHNAVGLRARTQARYAGPRFWLDGVVGTSEICHERLSRLEGDR